MEYTIKLKTTIQYEDMEYIKVNTDITDIEYIKELAIQQYKSSYNMEEDEIVNIEVLEVENTEPLYYSITLELSNNQSFSFLLKIPTKENIEEKIDKRIKRQLEKYNKIYNTNETVINRQVKELKKEELTLYWECVE